MCDPNKLSRFLLYYFVLELWILTPFVFTLCRHLRRVAECLSTGEGETSPTLESCIGEFPWYISSVTLAAIHGVNIFLATVLCAYVVYKRFKAWRYGEIRDQYYSHMIS
jgi:hypothetical protein